MTTIRLIAPVATLALAALLLAPGCKKSEAKQDPAKPNASAASKASPASGKKAEMKKGGGQHAAKGAQDSKQKLSSAVKEKKDKAEKKEEKMEDGVDCTAELEGLAWCDTDSELLFCSDGEWYQLDCAKLESGGFCGFDLESLEVSCFKDAE